MANSHSLDLEASSSQYASIADASQTGLDLSGDHTFEAWVKMETLPASTTYMMMVSKKGSSGNFGYLWGLYNSAGAMQVRMRVSSNGTNEEEHVVALGTFNTGTYYHIAGTFDASAHAIEVFKDGASVGTDTTGAITSIHNNNAPLYVGAYAESTPAFFFDGLIDEVKIYSDIRTDDEILLDMYSSPGSGDNLVAYWSLNNVYTDASGNGNTLTATNSPTFSTTVPFADYTGNSAFFAFFLNGTIKL